MNFQGIARIGFACAILGSLGIAFGDVKAKKLDLHLVAESPSATTGEYEYEGAVIHLTLPPAISSLVIEEAEMLFLPEGFAIVITMGESSKAAFAELTEKHRGKSLALVAEGIVLMKPVIEDVIENGEVSIGGTFSLEEAKSILFLIEATQKP